MGVVEAFDVVEDGGAGLVAGGGVGPVQEFGLEGGEERLGYCVVVGVASASHRHRDAGLLAAGPERPRGVLGGFKRSSQRLESAELQWKQGRFGSSSWAPKGSSVGDIVEPRADLKPAWVGVRRRSRVSCAATPQPVAEAWSIGPRPRSGIRIGVPAVRRWRSSPGNDKLRRYVQDRLGGVIARPDGELVPGPQVRWVGRRHGPRKDRRWATSWSPEQISGRLRVDFPHNESMRISHEAIYQAAYVQGRGALKRELVACLRTGRALRVPRARTRRRRKTFVAPEIMITQRPAEADDRAVPGHWEGDLIIGLHSSAIGTLVERTTRFTMLGHLPPMAGHRKQQRVHNGPSLAGHGAQAVRDAIAASIITLPQQLRRSLTWDQGVEMAQHAQLRTEANLDIYFCDPQSPWQRGTNENTNGLLRQYFPKGTDLHRHSRNDLDAVAAALNSRPRKTLNWKTPAETLNEHLDSLQQGSVATTP